MEIFNIFSFIHFFVLFGKVAVAKGADIRCYEGSFSKYTVYTLDNPAPILNSTFYQAGQKLVYYIIGYGGKANGKSVETIVNAYIGTANVCLLNWEKEASPGSLGPVLYPVKAIPNTIKIGNEFGESLIKLYNAGLNLADVHLIGFSLGGQLAGYSGRKVQESNVDIGRITGLDPAKPLFDGIISLRSLSASDASFVDIIHTNPNSLGSGEATGSVDIWPNCESNIQPGCDNMSLLQIVDMYFCSHNRSWEYFAEAINYPQAFIARSANNCDEWREGLLFNDTLFMGDDIDTQKSGNFYLRTNSEPMYGLGEEGSRPAIS